MGVVAEGCAVRFAGGVARGGRRVTSFEVQGGWPLGLQQAAFSQWAMWRVRKSSFGARARDAGGGRGVWEGWGTRGWGEGAVGRRS